MVIPILSVTMQRNDQQLFRPLMALALPIMGSSLLHTLYNLVDTFFLGKLGRESIAAPSIAFPIVYFFVVFASGFSTAGTTLISQSKGKNDRQKVDFYLGQVFSTLLGTAIFISIFGSIFSRSLLTLMAVPGETFAKAHQYMSIIFVGLPFMFMSFVLQAALHGVGDSITPLLIQVLTISINIALDPLFIFGIGFFPRLEVQGAAIATVISRFVGFSIAIVILLRGNKGLRLTFGNLKPQKQAVKLILKIGIPASIAQGVSALGFTVLQGVVNSFGTATIAAFGVANRITSLFNMPAMGFSRATAVMVGQKLGAKDRRAAWQVMKLSVLIVGIFVTVGMVFMFFRGALIVRIFIDDPEVLDMAATLFRIITVGMVFYTLFTVLMGGLQGAGDTKPIMYLNIARVWAFRFPLAYLLGYTIRLASDGIWYAMLISNVLIAIAGFIIIGKRNWMAAINPEEI